MINPHPRFPQDCLQHSHLQYYTSQVSTGHVDVGDCKAMGHKPSQSVWK